MEEGAQRDIKQDRRPGCVTSRLLGNRKWLIRALCHNTGSGFNVPKMTRRAIKREENGKKKKMEKFHLLSGRQAKFVCSMSSNYYHHHIIFIICEGTLGSQPFTANFCIWLDVSMKAIPFFMCADREQVTFGTCQSSSLSCSASRTFAGWLLIA